MGREWAEAGTGRRVHRGPELCPCRPVGTMGEWWGAGSYRGHQASPSLLDAGVRLCLFPLQPRRVTPAPGPGAVGSSRRPRPWICGPGLLTFAGAGPAGSTKVTPLKPLKGQAVQPGRGLGPQSWLACGLLAPGCPWLSFPIGRFGDPCAQSPSLQRVGALGLFPSSRRLFGGPGVAACVPRLPTASRLPSCGGCSFFQFRSFLVSGSSSAPVALVQKWKPRRGPGVQRDPSLRLQARAR